MCEKTEQICKHTPGPWFVPEGPFVSGLTVETRAIDEFIECPGSGGAMSVTTTICTLEWSGTPVWEANARLIAAAPKLKEALAAMLDCWGGYQCPEVDAAIAVMQEIGEDRWSMQAQMEAEGQS